MPSLRPWTPSGVGSQVRRSRKLQCWKIVPVPARLQYRSRPPPPRGLCGPPDRGHRPRPLVGRLLQCSPTKSRCAAVIGNQRQASEPRLPMLDRVPQRTVASPGSAQLPPAHRFVRGDFASDQETPLKSRTSLLSRWLQARHAALYRAPFQGPATWAPDTVSAALVTMLLERRMWL